MSTDPYPRAVRLRSIWREVIDRDRGGVPSALVAALLEEGGSTLWGEGGEGAEPVVRLRLDADDAARWRDEAGTARGAIWLACRRLNRAALALRAVQPGAWRSARDPDLWVSALAVEELGLGPFRRLEAAGEGGKPGERAYAASEGHPAAARALDRAVALVRLAGRLEGGLGDARWPRLLYRPSRRLRRTGGYTALGVGVAATVASLVVTARDLRRPRPFQP